ncbi:hypothetical protein Tco_0951559 [Tanacetum coccineum]|uniref:Pentatricopeptide repeat-containing protein n=1 Tax=Tanacetum coccineum TaxID=301880 RepID=A0ABQ5DVD7_9ASTR
MSQRRPLPSVVEFTQLLQSVTKMKHYSHSLDMFKQMCALRVPVNDYTMNIIIKCCCHLYRTNEAFAVFAWNFKRGIIPNVVTFSSLLNGLVLEHKILEAEIFFKKLIKDKLCEPNVVMYNTMIKGLCKIGNNNIAIQLLRLMDEKGCKPNVVTYNTIIDSLCKDKMVEDAFKLFKEMPLTPMATTSNEAPPMLASQRNRNDVNLSNSKIGTAITLVAMEEEAYATFKTTQGSESVEEWRECDSPSISQGTTSKAVVQPDLTNLPEKSRKQSCGSGLSKGLCLICASRYGNNPIPLNDSPNISKNVSQSPPQIDHHCCYECGDSLDDIFCQRCTCKSCGNGARYGYNCPPKVPIISNPEPCNNQTVDELPQTLPSFDPTCYSGDGSSFTCDSTPNFIDYSPNVFNPPPQPPTYSCEFCGNDVYYGHDCPPQVPFIYNPEPCYNQDFNFPLNFQCFQQQYICCISCGGPHKTFRCQQVISYEPCCENYGGPHETFQCQPMNQNFDNSNSSGFDQFQPSQFIIDHIDSMNDHLKAHRDFQQVMDDSMSKLRETFQTWLQQRQEQVVNLDTYTLEPSQYRKIPICYDDDDDEKSSIPLKDIIIYGLPPCVAITPEYSFSTQEYLKKFSSAITPDLPKSDSLIMEDEHLDTILETELDELIKSSVEDLVHTPSESDGISEGECDLLVYDDSSSKKDEIDLLIEEFAGELALIAPIPPGFIEANLDPKGDICFIENLMYDNSFPRPPETLKDDFETVIDSNNDYSSSDDDSYEDIYYVDASPPDSELVSLEEVKDFHPEDGEIEDDILREKLSKINLFIAKIEALKYNPTPSSDFVTKSSSTSPNLFLEETNTFDNSIPESETFCFDLEENSSGSTTTRSNYSLPGYEAFYFDDDHIEEKSSGSTTTHSDISLSKYDSFIFDLSNDPFPPVDRSDLYHKEFGDELAHIISPPEYFFFYFKSEPDPGELTSIVDSGIRENVLSTTNVNLPFEDDQSPLLAYVVWIFLPFFTYPVTPPYLLSCGNEDTIFDPGISVYHSFMPSVSHRSGTFMKFNVYPNNLNESPMEILSFHFLPHDNECRLINWASSPVSDSFALTTGVFVRWQHAFV